MDFKERKNTDNTPCEGSLDVGRGCRFCRCDGEATASACEGCYKLHSFNWLEDMPEVFPTDIFEVRFKNTRKSYYRNVNNLPLRRGDIVAVEASPGHDIGIVSLTGDLVARQMKRVGFNPQNGEFKKIYRKAKPYDIEKWQEAIALEHDTMIRARRIAADMKLNMKIGDVEYQGDKIKAIFYYIADERVDFRELIKVFAEQFRIRIEMKQIGARQEAGRIGGLGSCGRELCCASWISSFVSVTTNSARSQEISLNPQKLAGQCGKLKCCLVYELDTYLDARKDFPRVREPLQTVDGDYYLVKTDILSRTMWFSTDPHSQANMRPLGVDRVKEIIRANQKGQKVDRLADVSFEPESDEPTFADVVGEESLTRFDKQREGRRKNRKKKGGRKGAPEGQPQPSGASPEQRSAAKRREGEPRSDRHAPQGGRGASADRRGGKTSDRNRPSGPDAGVESLPSETGRRESARAAPGGEDGIAGGAAPKTRSMRSSRIIRLRTASRAVSRRFLFLAAWAVLPSCLSPERAFVADTDPGGWAVSEPAVVRFDNSDTVSARTIDLIVRYGRDFRYDRLSVAVTTVSPSGRQRRDTAVVMLPDVSGEPHVRRDAVGAFRSDAVLSETGTYLFSFVPLMPDPLVKGVAAVGVDIYRSED